MDKDLVVGVSRPESLDEGILRYVILAWLCQSLEEDFHLLVSEPQVEADEGLLELRKRYSLAAIVVNESKAGLDGEIVALEVLSDLLEHPPLPLDSVELLESIELLLLSFKCLVKLQVVQLVVGCLEAKDLRNQSLLLLGQGHSVLSQLTKEEPLAQPTQLVRRHCYVTLLGCSSSWLCLFNCSLLFEQGVVQEGHLVKELVGVDCQLVDDLLDQWSHLHESIDSTTNLLVKQVLQESHQLRHRYLASAALVKVELQQASLVQRDGLAEASDDLAELSPRDEACLVDVEYLDDLPHLQLLLEDRVCYVVQDIEGALAVCATLLGLAHAFAHLGFQEALTAQLVRDMGQGVHKLYLAHHVVALVIYVVEELHEVLNGDIELKALSTTQESLLGQRACSCSIKDTKELLKSEPKDILGLGQLLTALGNEWIDEALVDACHIDPFSGHEIDEALERALELAMVCLPHIAKNSLCLVPGENDLEPLEDLLKALGVGQLVGHVLQLTVDDGLEGKIEAFKRLLDLLIQIIELLSADQRLSSQSFQVLLLFKCKRCLVFAFVVVHERGNSLEVI